MLKQRIENKASTKPGQEDVFTAMSGKMYRRADVENPSRPGFLRDELVPILPDHWAAGSYFDLLTPTHKRMRPLPLSPDPLEATAAEAPADKLADLERARVAVESARAKTHEAAVARDLAWLRKKTEWERKKDWPSFKRAEHAEKEAVVRWLEAREDEEREVRRLLLPAEAAIEQGRRFESLRRRQVAYPPSPAPTGPSATIQTVGKQLGPEMITLS